MLLISHKQKMLLICLNVWLIYHTADKGQFYMLAHMLHEDCFADQCILRNSFLSDTKLNQIHVLECDMNVTQSSAQIFYSYSN